MSLPTKQKIANQLFFKVLSIYLTILAVVLLSLSVIAFDNEKQKIKQELSLLGQKGAIELSEPLWFFDEEQIKGKVESLQKNNFVTKLDLFDQQQENRLFSISDASDRWQFSSTTKVTYDHEMGTDLVGVLVLYSNATVLLNRISLELMIMASGMLLMLVTLWLALRSAGDRLLSQPLQKLGDYYQNVNLTSINRQKSITWKDDNNELTTLADESKKMLSRLHQSTQELLLAKNQIDLIIDTMGEGIAVLDSEGQITLVNQRFETMSGYSQQSLARKQLSELFTSKRDEESLPTILRDLSVPLATLFTHNQDKFDLLTQESPLSTLIIDENGIIISSNKAFTMLSGWKSEQLQGETLEPLLPESIRDTHQQLFNQYIHSPEARSMGGRLLPLVTAKGKLKELEIGLIPLQKEEKSYVMVVLHDPIAQRIWEFFKITTLGRLIQGSTDRVQLQYQLQQENGNTLPVEVSIATMNQQIDASTDASAVLVVHDITDKIKQAHREQYEAFQSGLAEMSATVLHNIGNVVTGVSSAALSCSKRVEHLGQINHAFTQLDQQLQQGTLNHQEYVEKAQMVDNIIKEIREGKSGRRGLSRLSADINEGIKHITDMIRSFRENSQDRVTRSHFNLHEMVKDTVNIVEGQLNKYKIELKIDISEKIELNLPRNLTIQMMLNLIKNSIEAIRNRRYSDTTESGLIEMRAEQEGKMVTLCIRDNGCGIAKSLQPTLFERGTTTKEGSAGIGLHSVATYVQSINGKHWIESGGKNRGASFFVSLPLSDQ